MRVFFPIFFWLSSFLVVGVFGSQNEFVNSRHCDLPIFRWPPLSQQQLELLLSSSSSPPSPPSLFLLEDFPSTEKKQQMNDPNECNQKSDDFSTNRLKEEFISESKRIEESFTSFSNKKIFFQSDKRGEDFFLELKERVDKLPSQPRKIEDLPFKIESLKELVFGKKPFLVRGIADEWPASSLWSPFLLESRFGEETVFLKRSGSQATHNMTLREFFEYMKETEDSSPLYLFDQWFFDDFPELSEDYSPPVWLERYSFFRVLPADWKPPLKWMLIGGKRSGTGFLFCQRKDTKKMKERTEEKEGEGKKIIQKLKGWHVDPYQTSAWNALLFGKKRWAFYPPQRKEPPGSWSSLSVGEWHDTVLPSVLSEDHPLLCTQLPGEMMFVPWGWWHCVLNLEETIAVTENFINEANFRESLDELKRVIEKNGDYAPMFLHLYDFWREKLPSLWTQSDDLFYEMVNNEDHQKEHS